MMDALVVYGSLINKAELSRHGFSLNTAAPIVVRGFKRIFCQEPSWRTSGQGEERAVLNAISSHDHWLNGLLITGLNDDVFINLDERERGYVRIKVDSSYVRGYEFLGETITPQNNYIYTGKIEKQSDAILPNMSYLRICLDGAKQWGEEFYNDFLDSTFVKNTVVLRTYLGKPI